MILVTGGTGLVGSHLLLELISSGEKVKALYRNPGSFEAVIKVFSYSHSQEKSKELFNRIQWIRADITDIPSLESAFQDVKKVYHCAALVSFDPSKDTQLRKVNIEGTANVVNLCIRQKVEKLCFVSSIATLDKRPGTQTITENSHWNKEKDHSMYAITKYGAEMEVWRASQEGIPIVIVNPGIIIGPGFWKSGSGELFSKVDNGLRYYLTKVTGFIGVGDVVELMKELMDSSIENEQYILVSENLSFQKVLSEVSFVLGKPEASAPLKPWMVYLGWILEKIAAPFRSKERKLNRDSVSSLFTDTFYSNEKITEHLHYKFAPVKAGIKHTGQIYSKEVRKK